MTKASDDVIEKRTEINGSLVDLETERQRLCRDGDPLGPVDLRTAAFVLAVERVARVAARSRDLAVDDSPQSPGSCFRCNPVLEHLPFPEWAVTRRSMPAAVNRSPIICAESGTTRSAGLGLVAERSVRTARAAPFFR